MALPAHGSLYLARAGTVVRHRLEGDLGRGEPNLHQVFGQVIEFLTGAPEFQGKMFIPLSILIVGGGIFRLVL
jgi:hypothetical protein